MGVLLGGSATVTLRSVAEVEDVVDKEEEEETEEEEDETEVVEYGWGVGVGMTGAAGVCDGVEGVTDRRSLE